MGKSTGTTIEVWKGRAHWHWHFKRSNGRIVADAENFPSEGNATRAAKTLVTALHRELGGAGEALFHRLPDRGDGVTRFRVGYFDPLAVSGTPVPIEIKLP